MEADKLNAKLAEWWEIIRKLKLAPPQEEWDKYVSHLHPDAVVYLNGMSNPAARGVDEVISEMKKTMGFWSIVERKVLSQGIDDAGKVAFCNMNNRLAIFSEEIDLPEAEVATFDDQGRIVDYKRHCDPAPIIAIVQKRMPSA